MWHSWHTQRSELPPVCPHNTQDSHRHLSQPFSRTDVKLMRLSQLPVTPLPVDVCSLSRKHADHSHHHTHCSAATGRRRVRAVACADCGDGSRCFFGAHAASPPHRHCAQHLVGRHELAPQLLALQPPPPSCRHRGSFTLSAHTRACRCPHLSLLLDATLTSPSF